MDLILAICAAVGLGLAVGVGGPLAWLFVAVMASFEAGIDPTGTDWDFIGSTGFVSAMFAVNIAAFFLARAEMSRRIPFALGALVLGAIYGAAALAAEGETVAIGLVAGGAVGAGASILATDVLEGAARRASAGPDAPDTSGTLALIFGFVGIVVAALALFVPPASIAALAALVFLAAARRRKAGEKYEGLRILR